MPDPELFPGVATHYRGHHFAVLDTGAQALAWTPANQLPVLWSSPLADFAPGSAVRGGVPVVFPWFGAGPTGDKKPAHGFARTTVWERTAVTDDLVTGGDLTVRHSLDGALANAGFRAKVVTRFSNHEFQVHLEVTNTGDTELSYEAALHSYFAISSIAGIAVEGLDGCGYTDKVGGGEHTQTGRIQFDGETDRIYHHTGETVIDDPTWGRRLLVTKSGSANTVVWNPGPERGAAIKDVGEYHADFVCVEAANIGVNAITLPAGEAHTLTQTVRLA